MQENDSETSGNEQLPELSINDECPFEECGETVYGGDGFRYLWCVNHGVVAVEDRSVATEN